MITKFAVFATVWILCMLFGEFALKLTSFGWIAVWGAASLFIADFAQVMVSILLRDKGKTQ